MTDLYLITGFLGAGKTTFLKKFIRLFDKQKLFLIVNEFGKAGIDGALLGTLSATLAEINNGSIFCACRLDKFEETLDGALTAAPDVILVEASGLADPTNIRRVLAHERYADISYKGSVCMVDAVRFGSVVQTARVCPKQLAVSSIALLNKCDLATAKQLCDTRAAVLEINPALVLHEVCYGEFEKDWLADLVVQPDLAEAAMGADITLQKACLTLAPGMTRTQLAGLIALLAEDTYRLKGFVQLDEGLFFADCVGPMTQLSPYTGAADTPVGQLVALAGKGMPLRKSLQKAREWYGDWILEVEQ